MQRWRVGGLRSRIPLPCFFGAGGAQAQRGTSKFAAFYDNSVTELLDVVLAEKEPRTRRGSQGRPHLPRGDDEEDPPSERICGHLVAHKAGSNVEGIGGHQEVSAGMCDIGPE